MGSNSGHAVHGLARLAATAAGEPQHLNGQHSHMLQKKAMQLQ
jgi:hypothetical protein